MSKQTKRPIIRFTPSDDLSSLDADACLIASAYDYHEAMKNALLDAGELEGDDAGYVAITLDAWQMLKKAHAKAEGK